MVKAFTREQRGEIRKQLMAEGRRLFAAYGLKKTNVEELTRACGIAKGTFYTFYRSKEELFMDILEETEAEIKKEIAESLKQTEGSPREVFKDVMLRQFSALKNNPVLSIVLRKDEYTHLLRGLPPERLRQHLENDEDALQAIIRYWRGQGIVRDIGDSVISGMIKGVFFMHLHQEEIGTPVFQEVIERMLELVAQAVLKS